MDTYVSFNVRILVALPDGIAIKNPKKLNLKINSGETIRVDDGENAITGRIVGSVIEKSKLV